MKNYKRILASACAVLCLTAFTACASKSEKLLELIDSGDYSAAVDYYDEKIDDSSKERELRKEVKRGMRKRYDDILEKYNKGEISEDAMESFFELMDDLKIDDDDDDYAEFLSKYKTYKQYKDYLDQADKYMKEEDYSEAVYYLKMIPEESGCYKDAQKKLTEASDKLAESKLASVESYIEDGEYTYALSTLDSYKSELSESDKYKELREKAETGLVEKAKKEVEEYFEYGDYSAAYELLYYDYDYYEVEGITKMLDTLEDDFVDYAIKKAEGLAKDEEYEEAVEYLETASESMYGNSTLDEAAKKYRAYLPTFITELEYDDIEGSVYSNERKDNKSNEYSSAFSIDGGGEQEWWAEYSIGGNYNIFSGIVGVPYSQRSTGDTKYFEIYADGKLIYKSPEMNKDSDPVEFKLNVTGVKKLRIVYPATPGNNSVATIYDGLFTKGETKGVEFSNVDGASEETTEAATEEAAETTTTASSEGSTETTTTTTTTA